ncbi:Dual specificity protein phosphatase 15 [Leucoagaricus sp. SymC.cos]|nr:Dual specificity protein phosphatase 15 [Leucoagaricus sp. SymC.cos]
MNEVIPGLWIGDLPSALNVEKLKANNIFSILSAMRGRITVNQTFIRHQILIDDTEDADILAHLSPSIHFIQAELDKGRGVLVHCQAGVSRSATIVAAYLMYRQNLSPHEALELIKKARPYIDPNPNFLQQLELFHKSNFRISKKEKDIRRYYLGRTVEEVMNGDGTISGLDMLASYPRTPASDSTPSTPSPVPRRRIRCKLCRQELAAREHMLDHGQLGPATPASMTPAASRRPSEDHQRPSSGHSASITNPTGTSPRRPSRSRLSFGSGILGDSLTMTTIDSSGSAKRVTEEPREVAELTSLSLAGSNSGAERLKNFRRLSDAIITPTSESTKDTPSTAPGTSAAASAEPSVFSNGAPTVPSQEPMTTHLISPANLAAQLYANPKLAALRSPSFGSSSIPSSPISPSIAGSQPKIPLVSAPIIVNPKCSGYFVEPMKWMEPFLQEGHLSGKIVCPNKKCGAKLGNYDWAGVCCGCKEWVVPGFCINRSKVDEVAI